MGITELWTIIAVVLHLCGVGAFAEWPIIAGPLNWSCLCVELWVLMFYGLLLALTIIFKILTIATMGK